jgi:hypothetical protein
VPLCSAAEQATAGPLESPPSPTAFPAPLLARYAQSFLGPDPGIWDDDILLLRSVDLRAVDRVRAEFTTGRFLQWRFTCGLLREELALHQQMPLRQILLRDTAALLAYDLRYTAGGVQTLCAFARPAPFDDYVIPLQLRGKRIAEGGGNYGVVPMGVHSPAPAGPLVVAAPSTSGLREMYEELFGGPEHRPGQPPPPLFTEHPAIAWILDHRERVTWEMTAFCVSMIHGNYDFACLLAVHDAEFWTRFGGLMEASWESEEHLFLSSKDEAAWRAVLAQPNWESQAMIACVEGRKRLAELV